MSQDKKENNSESNNNWSKRELGALWLRQGKKQKYLTGYIESDDLEGEKKRVIIFKKLNKPNDRAPDYVIYESEEYTASDSTASDSTSKQTSTPEKQTPQEERDDIPAF